MAIAESDLWIQIQRYFHRTRKNPNFYIGTQNYQIAKAFLNTENNVGGIIISNFKLYWTTLAMVWFCQQSGHIQ